MRIVAISDTHEDHRRLIIPECDLLIHAGDLTYQGSTVVLRDFNEWVRLLKLKGTIKECIAIAGNHDLTLADRQRRKQASRAFTDFIYLKDESVEYGGLKFWGHPWTPTFGNWGFMHAPGPMADIVRRIPKDIDVLVSHGPPQGVLDYVDRDENVGCKFLRKYVDEQKHKLKLHVFGHIHEQYGIQSFDRQETLFVNASSLDDRYELVHWPIVLEYDVVNNIVERA
jgi:Icc-related predicted phosphoesterase